MPLSKQLKRCIPLQAQVLKGTHQSDFALKDL